MQTEQCTLQSDLEEIEATLAMLLQTKEERHSHLYEAARYAALGAGKRLRPLLCLAVARLLGAASSTALVPAAALELVHCYSLIHDDLPAMDNDDYRRGKPTLHKMYPEGHAILTGDYLLTYAFEILSKAPGLSAEKKVRLIELLSEAAGGEGMVGGQVRDIDTTRIPSTIEDLEELHLRKTGRMFQASILFGAILGGADTQQFALLETLSKKLGLAFQIYDDVIDVLHSEEKHGRSVPSDQTNRKSTYVSLLGLAGAQQRVHELIKEIYLLIGTLPQPNQQLILILNRAFSLK